ncbi:MAG: hypothetical protein B7Y83_06190 [Flavobacteriales bacterium 32-34-25]|nr:MAG: hypothetical protein B7Y83_06190 [Flavobacteriales bacterium 32-34-25]
MNTSFIASIHGIEMDSPQILLSKYELKVNNDPNWIEEFYIDEVKRIVGLAQYENSINWKTYLYTELDIQEKFNGKQILAYLLKISKHLPNALWLIKDNSVRFQTGHLKFIDGIFLTVDSNVINGLYSNCFGEKDSVVFTQAELELASNFFDFFFELTYDDSENVKLESTHAEVNRVNRAYYFLDLARTNYDIGTKVSMYCSAFECLFSVATAELKHRLSETVANFIGNTPEEKRIIYDQMKSIYDLRSSVTHGSGINKKLITNDATKLKEIGRNCDTILRKCFFKISTSQEIYDMYLRNSNEEIGEFFTNLIFR